MHCKIRKLSNKRPPCDEGVLVTVVVELVITEQGGLEVKNMHLDKARMVPKPGPREKKI